MNKQLIADPFACVARIARTQSGHLRKETSYMGKKITLRHPELVAVEGGEGKIYFGGKTEWLDRAGCGHLRGGIVTAAEMITYLAATRSGLQDFYPPQTQRTQEDFEAMMVELAGYFSASRDRQLSLACFVDGINAFADHNGHHLSLNVLDIPEQTDRRPSADRCLGFVDEALKKDAPVAFLRRGVDPMGNTDRQWRLIVQRRGNYVVLADNGFQNKLDFRLWYDTAARGGALVFAVRNPL